MAGPTVCPRCGARDSFMKGYLPETCVCRICLSQLDWREIPGCGPDCKAAPSEGEAEGEAERTPTPQAEQEGQPGGASEKRDEADGGR